MRGRRPPARPRGRPRQARPQAAQCRRGRSQEGKDGRVTVMPVMPILAGGANSMNAEIEAFRQINFGDCEVDLISFSGNNMRLNVVDDYYNRSIVVEFMDTSYFAAETNCMQNVIAKISIFTELNDLHKDNLARRFVENRKIEIEKEKPSAFIAYVQPIAGFEAIILFNDLDYNIIESRDSAR
jgi:hypothetical protein